MIDAEKHGIEAGDRIRIIIEGAVKLDEDSFSQARLAIDGMGLYPWPGLTWTTEPTVEILEKTDPAWWTAKVIKAIARGAGIDPLYLVAGGGYDTGRWIDGLGVAWGRDELSDVEVIVP